MTSTNVQTFNGTARLEHKADIALMVTNVAFSESARDFANDHAIHLTGAAELSATSWSSPSSPVRAYTTARSAGSTASSHGRRPGPPPQARSR
ncbi:restriction endonuclease [Streptomyces sp. A30]|uniref:restriction endonuclease n=1 Tax=Streptomyces sp. A30 TaxID=2789273 RepID=UPI003980996F